MYKARCAISVLLASAMLLPLAGCLNRDPIGPSALESYAKKHGAEVYRDATEFSHDYNDLYGDLSEISDGMFIRVRGDDIERAIDFTDDISVFYSENIKEASVFIEGDVNHGIYSNCCAISMIFGVEEDASSYYDIACGMYTASLGEFDYEAAAHYDPYLASSIQENDAMIKQLEEEIIEELRNSGASDDVIDEYLDLFEDLYEVDDDLVMESFEKEGMTFTLLHGKNGYVYYAAGIYLCDRTVLYLYSFGTDEDTCLEYLDDICDELGLESPSVLYE